MRSQFDLNSLKNILGISTQANAVIVEEISSTTPLSAHGGFVTHTYSCNKKCNQSHTDDAIEGAGGYVPLDRREPRT